MKHSEYSAVIIGSGAAGLYAALKIARSGNLPDGVLLLTKAELGESNSKYAQGGIVGVMNVNPEDNTELHIQDTLKAGAGINNEKVVKYISEISDNYVKHPSDVLKIGQEVDVYVKAYDPETHKISLGYKTEESNPSDTANTARVMPALPFSY